jgi:hypothetical protein
MKLVNQPSLRLNFKEKSSKLSREREKNHCLQLEFGLVRTKKKLIKLWSHRVSILPFHLFTYSSTTLATYPRIQFCQNYKIQSTV